MVRKTGCAAKPFALLFDPGDTLRAPVALLDVDMGGGALMGGIVAAAGVVAAHGRFGAGGRVVSGHVPIGFVAAVAAADRIGLPGVMDLDAAQAAGARLVVAGVALLTVEITHSSNTSADSMSPPRPVMHGGRMADATKSSQASQRFFTN